MVGHLLNCSFVTSPFDVFLAQDAEAKTLTHAQHYTFEPSNSSSAGARPRNNSTDPKDVCTDMPVTGMSQILGTTRAVQDQGE